MPDLQQIIQSGSAHAWLYLPIAILLGALHGLEPGHSKTMMAAFIIAVRGTIAQAILLGLAAAFSHSLLIAVLAIGALQFGSRWNAETIEPYLQLASAAAVLGMALWMFLRTRREVREADEHHHEHHHHGHHHDHQHEHDAVEEVIVKLGPDDLAISIYEIQPPPVFRLHWPNRATMPSPSTIQLETVRSDGTRKSFHLIAREHYLESLESIPEPHAFKVLISMRDEESRYSAEAEFHEPSHEPEPEGDFQDAHELEHAREIQERFAGRTVTTSQIVLFGLTGGLLPCPAAFSVLLICLQIKRMTLGFAMVGAFSFGLALTMVATGALAAWSVGHANRKFRGFGELMRRAPYLSCLLLVLVAGYMAWHGWHGLVRL